MACFKSLLARRILLWYILVACFVVFGFSWSTIVGCDLVSLSNENESASSIGLFSMAVFDDDGDKFLGCIKYSNEWNKHVSGQEFHTARWFGALLGMFITIATSLCLLVQCFNKHGKSCLWSVMKWSYAFALVCQGMMSFIWASDIVESCREDTCEVSFGADGKVAVANMVLLLGMVIATFNSPPPLNPVFRCWNASDDDYDIEKGDTDEETHAENGSREDDHVSDSVSLLGSRASSKRMRSSRSLGSKQVSKMAEIKEDTPLPEPTSAAKEAPPSELGSRFIHREREQVADPPIRNYYRSFRQNFARFENKSHRTLETSDSNSQEDTTTIQSEKSKLEPSGASLATEDPVETVLVKVKPTPKVVNKVEKVASADSVSERGGSLRSAGSSRSGSSSQNTAAILESLSRSVVLGKGGKRVTEERIGNTVKIVDEYPASSKSRKPKKSGDDQEDSSDGSEIVKIRTEYCPEGRKTVREAIHPDGSRTVTTLIDPETMDWE